MIRVDIELLQPRHEFDMAAAMTPDVASTRQVPPIDSKRTFLAGTSALATRCLCKYRISSYVTIRLNNVAKLILRSMGLSCFFSRLPEELTHAVQAIRFTLRAKRISLLLGLILTE